MTNSSLEPRWQHTIANVVRISGTGIHTGESCKVRLRPAADGTGRVIVKDGYWIPAVSENVTDTNRCTTIGREGTHVHTVEHLLAALYVLEIDNILIELDGPELPILDGSAEPWMRLLQEAAIEQQSVPSVVATVTETHTFEVGSSTISIEPVTAGSGLTATAIVDFDMWPQGNCSCTWNSVVNGSHVFRNDIAPARTWTFYSEVEQLRAAGLSRGASLENALVITPPNGYSSELRVPQEWAKHKLLDLIGDLALVGARLEAAVTVKRPGHRSNNAAALAICRMQPVLQVSQCKLNNEGK